RPEDRTGFGLYEAAEGGAGVLRLLVEDPTALSRCAELALRRCHYAPDDRAADGWADQGHAPGRRDDCEAACYDCLLSYTNQPDHRLLDRKDGEDGIGLKSALIALLPTTATVDPTAFRPAAAPAKDEGRFA